MKKQKTKKHTLSPVSPLLAAIALTILVVSVGAVAKEVPIFRFNLKDGAYPVTGLVADAQGDLYGVTPTGGDEACFGGCGVVFELSPGSGSTWTEKVIYAFKGGTSDASGPITNLIFDGKGDLFGATTGSPGSRSVFELTPSGNGDWTEKILYTFTNKEGYYPGTQLAFDKKGNLYGALSSGGPNNNGVIYELSPQSNGTWQESSVYAFGAKDDGQYPNGGVVLDSEGDIYGATQLGGSSGVGTVFQLTPSAGGTWTETILYDFGSTGGDHPNTPLTIQGDKNLFGTTLGSPYTGQGTVFELTQIGGQWRETTLYTFGAPPDGNNPSGVAFDSMGNLYGTAQYGGSGCNNPGCGIVFQLTPQSGGTWKERVLYNFASAADGSQSNTGVFVDSAGGRLFGTTRYGGGRYGYGTVFEVGH